MPRMVAVHHQKHLQWECKGQNSSRKNVAWADESRFLLHHMDSSECCLPGEVMAPGCTVVQQEDLRGSLMHWAMFCWETMDIYVDVNFNIPNT